ncbi:MAG: hypothetical protein FJ167_04615, partial [Gammaproteobacteria bacterium]|nr:hypothetical protein [Gammaproteobacteria bacterium]
MEARRARRRGVQANRPTLYGPRHWRGRGDARNGRQGNAEVPAAVVLEGEGSLGDRRHRRRVLRGVRGKQNQRHRQEAKGMNGQSTNLYTALAENFPQEMERTVTKGGTALTYIPVSEVINRLNKVLGVDRWSFTIVRCERDAADPDFVVAHVRIEYFATDFQPIARDGFGG